MANLKLPTRLLDSKVWLLDATARVVWLTLMCMADDGVVVGSGIANVAHRSNVRELDCEEALTKLERSGLVQLTDRGWRMQNYEKFASIQTRKQEAGAARAARYRARKAGHVK